MRTREMKVNILSDGLNVTITELRVWRKEEGTNIHLTVRESNKIIPYLLIDREEDRTSYHITNLRDPKLGRVNYSEIEGITLKIVRLRFSGFTDHNEMIWKGTI